MRRAASVRVLALLASFAAALPAASGEPAPAERASDPEAAALIERVESYHQSLPHFEARFEQRFSPRIFGRDRVEAGRLTVKRPARMRWDYESPEPKAFVSDGERTWFHVPTDQQVVVGNLGDGTGEETGNPNPLHFLTGDATILDHFDALIAAEQPDSGLRTVSLVPRAQAAEITSLTLTVSAASGRIETIEYDDLEGNRTSFRFSDYRFATAPDDALFTFTIPPGTDVVTATDLRQ